MCLKPTMMSEEDVDFVIERKDDLWIISGKRLARIVSGVNFADYESRMYFDRALRKAGLFEKLEEMGISEGDTVSIYDIEFDYMP